MRCHYQVLGLRRDASDEELRRVYRRLALRWHPDKNPENPEDAAEQFKLIQAAYDVLSDPQERAWYDNHREAILKGGLDGEFKDDSLDLLQFFTSACYCGYSDGPEGFYAVYRHVFDTIAQEELEGAPSPEGLSFPSFGHPHSDYETVVHPFYAHWQSFCTSRTLAWTEKYDTRQAANRWEKRAMEKENRRVRDRARRECSELVRQLVAFVRRRDRRVHAHRQRLQDLNSQKVQRSREYQRQQALRQASLAEQYEEQSWVTLSDLERELQQMEAQYQREFGDGSGQESGNEEDRPQQNGGAEDADGEPQTDVTDLHELFCPACDRTFQSGKTMRNHEKSKRHREMVALLRQQLEMEERVLHAACGGEEELPPDCSRLSKKHKKKKRQQKMLSESAEPLIPSASGSQSEAESSEEHGRCTDSGDRQGQGEQPPPGTTPPAEQEKTPQDTGQQEGVGIEGTATPDPALRLPKTKGKKAKQPKQMGGEAENQSLDVMQCVSCSCQFPSRNKLFEHLRATGHATAVPDPRAASGRSGRTSSGKRRNR